MRNFYTTIMRIRSVDNGFYIDAEVTDAEVLRAKPAKI